MNMITGVKKMVLDKDGLTHTGCHGCPHCRDTGFSYICGKTGEKLEGFDTKEDKDNNNTEALLRRNILVGVGKECPLAVINKSAMTKIKFVPSLEDIVEFVKNNSVDVFAEIEEDVNGNDCVGVWVTWFDDGYSSDEDFKVSELFDVVDALEDKFDVEIEDCECGSFDEMEKFVITLP